MSDFERDAFMLDLVEAINTVAREHDAPQLEKVAAVSALAEEGKAGNWYELSEKAKNE